MKNLLMKDYLAQAAHDGLKTQTRRDAESVFTRHRFSVTNENHPAGWLTLRHQEAGEEFASRSQICHEYAKYKPGELVYIKEPWAVPHEWDGHKIAELPHDAFDRVYHGLNMGGLLPRNAMFMPQRASRTIVRITDVRLEQLGEISYADCIAEGIYKTKLQLGNLEPQWFYKNYVVPEDLQDCSPMLTSAKESFATLWNSIFGDFAFERDANKWVFVYEFERVK